ncbi:MAG: IPExxxVDY family protein [Maribacter sp.]
MAAVYKINDDFYDESFALVAVHTTLQDYSLAYELNQGLNLKLKRARKDFDLAENKSFPYFEWEDVKRDIYWVLISNQSCQQQLLANNDLFQNESTFIKPRLIPEYKDVDYLLKIESENQIEIDKFIKKIASLPQVMASYEVKTDKLKSKNNLIF